MSLYRLRAPWSHRGTAYYHDYAFTTTASSLPPGAEGYADEMPNVHPQLSTPATETDVSGQYGDGATRYRTALGVNLVACGAETKRELAQYLRRLAAQIDGGIRSHGETAAMSALQQEVRDRFGPTHDFLRRYGGYSNDEIVQSGGESGE